MANCEHGFADAKDCWKCLRAKTVNNPTGRPHAIEIAVVYRCSWCGFKRERLSYIEDAARVKRVDIDADAHRVCEQCQIRLTSTNSTGQ